MESDLSKFKHVLEYFVTHLNYLQSDYSETVMGFDKYIKPFLDEGDFTYTGQGYNDGKIQKQISKWENICKHRLCVNVQPQYGKNYKSKRCYLNWIGTGLNIFSNWNKDEVSGLSVGYAYWWMKPTGYKIVMTKTIKELNLFSENGDDSSVKEFFDLFVKEIDDYDNETSAYYLAEQKYHEQEKQLQIMKATEHYITLLKTNHNVILTGAPGTGKTYLAKIIAQQMILGNVKDNLTDNEQKQFDEQCGFVQFHPSYDYTDFVEGLRPCNDNGNVGFEIKDGVFKEFCKKAVMSQKTNGMDNFDESWDKLVEYLSDNDFLDVPFISNKSKTFRVELNEYGTGLANRTYLDNNFQKGEWIKGQSKFFNKEQLYNIYKGASGVPSGGHDNYRRAIVEIMKSKFGLHPYKEGDVISDEGKPYVFIIDEINRGEISKIFGELFFSIDPGYRGDKRRVKTQYSNLIEESDVFKKGFYVPKNVYIIGTMNDIDRSVESMDFAFRRRFAFKEIKADDRIAMLDDLDWKDDAIKRMQAINARIEKIDGLSRAYHIGPAYFLKLKNYDGDFDLLWENHLEGLLLEYMRGMTNCKEVIKELAKIYRYTKMDRYE